MMSGGSLDYLYRAEAIELFDREADMAQAAEVFENLGHSDAAREIELFHTTLRNCVKWAEVKGKRLRDLWEVAERYLSCDDGPDEVRKAVHIWRGEHDGIL